VAFDPTRFYRPREVWRGSGAPRSMVYDALASGELPALRRGNRWLIPGQSAIEWIEGVVPSVSDPAHVPQTQDAPR
jgi:hypothetical protein